MIDIKTILEKHGISTKSWGTGSAKTIEHLQKELFQILENGFSISLVLMQW